MNHTANQTNNDPMSKGVPAYPCQSCGVEAAKAETDGKVGLRCDNSHFLCPDDCQHFINTCLKPSNWLSDIPMKCPVCKSAFHQNALEALMTPKQKADYLTACMKMAVPVNDNEMLVECPFCVYKEIHDVKEGYSSDFMFCLSPKCRKVSCKVCMKQYVENKDDPMTHLMDCHNLGRDLRVLQDAVDLGNKVGCPHCGLLGMKDDACSHITCARCCGRWCYVCGKRATAVGNFVGHNTDWENNEARCPLMMEAMHYVDPDCPESGPEAMAYFHRMRSLRLLQEAFTKLGSARVAAVLNKFPSALAGFTLQEVAQFKKKRWFRGV